MFSFLRSISIPVDRENFGIYSFYKSNVSEKIVIGQKKVFNHLGFDIHQICDDQSCHGAFLNKIIQDVNTPEYLIFFDIDCIPLKKTALAKILNQIADGKSIAGAAQTVNHFLNGKNIYVGPFFFGLSKRVYANLNSPDMREGQFWDVGGLLTMAALFQGETKIGYWYPTSVEVPKWNLHKNGKFGLGTTYEHKVYHAFESRLGDSNSSYLKKCEEVLNRKA